MLGLTGGEFFLVAFIFGLIYVAGRLSKVASWLARDDGGSNTKPS